LFFIFFFPPRPTRRGLRGAPPGRLLGAARPPVGRRRPNKKIYLFIFIFIFIFIFFLSSAGDPAERRWAACAD
jgi:hypothetical protein